MAAPEAIRAGAVELVATGRRETCPTCGGTGDAGECFSCDGTGRTLVVRFRSIHDGPKVYAAPSRALLEISECEDDVVLGELDRLPEVAG